MSGHITLLIKIEVTLLEVVYVFLFVSVEIYLEAKDMSTMDPGNTEAHILRLVHDF
jgi:hypothetical protein